MTFSLVNVLAVSFVLLGIFGFSQQKKEEDKTAKISFVLMIIAAFLTILVNTKILGLPVEGTFMAVVYFSMLGLSLLVWLALKEKCFSPLLLYLSALQLLVYFQIVHEVY